MLYKRFPLNICTANRLNITEFSFGWQIFDILEERKDSLLSLDRPLEKGTTAKKNLQDFFLAIYGSLFKVLCCIFGRGKQGWQ